MLHVFCKQKLEREFKTKQLDQGRGDLHFPEFCKLGGIFPEGLTVYLSKQDIKGTVGEVMEKYWDGWSGTKANDTFSLFS